MSENKIAMPSSGGGLISYSGDYKSKLTVNPMVVITIIAIVALIEIYLYKFI